MQRWGGQSRLVKGNELASGRLNFWIYRGRIACRRTPEAKQQLRTCQRETLSSSEACEAQHPVIALIQPEARILKSYQRWNERYMSFRATFQFILYTLKNRGCLLTSTVLWRNFNIRWTFPFHKRLFIVDNGSSNWENVFTCLFILIKIGK